MTERIRLFLAGDVMTGRGIDQILPNPCDPQLHEPYVHDAREYVALAEEANGPIAKPVGFSYVWGDALAALERFAPDARIVNLETSVTTSDSYWRGKSINYRMNPDNVGCLVAAALDCCVVANNHVLDWGYSGLGETLSVLRSAGLRPVGAGMTAAEAREPAVIDLGSKGRVLVFAYGSPTSGIPYTWAVGRHGPGVSLLPEAGRAAEMLIADAVHAWRRPGDLIVVSIHWGANWGYRIPREQTELAHALVERVGVDVVHGHSSHHPLGIEILHDRPIIYGCGDFINDYEGISGHAEYRGDLRLAYQLELIGGGLAEFEIVPYQAHRLRLRPATHADVRRVETTLRRESAPFGVGLSRSSRDSLSVAVDRSRASSEPVH